MDCYAQIVKPIKHPYGVETLLVNQFAMLVGYITSYITSAVRSLWKKKQSKWVELNLSQTFLLHLAFERFLLNKARRSFLIGKPFNSVLSFWSSQMMTCTEYFYFLFFPRLENANQRVAKVQAIPMEILPIARKMLLPTTTITPQTITITIQ